MGARAVWSAGSDAGRTWLLRAGPVCALLVLSLCSFLFLVCKSSAEARATTPVSEPREATTVRENSETKPLSQGQNAAANPARRSVSTSQALSFFDSMRPGPYKGRSSVYSNAGPDCYNLAATTLTVPKGLCTETCVLVWTDGKKQYASCKDRVTCFLRDYTSRQVQAAQAGIPRKLSAAISRECSFVSKSPHLPLDQFQHMFILSASDVEHHGSWDAASACTAGQRLDVAGALVGPKAVVAGTAAESVGCESINVTSHLKDICAEAIKNPTERCIIEPSVYSNIISKFSCNVKETPYLALYVTCIDVKVDDDVGCKVVTPASSQPDPGGCTCPSGTVQCSLDESRLYGDVMSGIAYGYTVHTKHNRGFKNGNVTAFQTPFCSGATVKVACKNAPDSASKKGEPATTAWLDRGPNCYKPTDSDNRQMCKFACLKLWNPADGALVNVNTPFDDFKDRIKSGRLTVMELTADGNAAIRSCDWGKIRVYGAATPPAWLGGIRPKRIRFAPAEQYEYETWTTSEALSNFCPNSGTLQIVRAFLGCSYSLVDGNESQNCNYVDITKEVTKKCGSAWRSSKKGCTLGADELVAEADACETSCEGEWGIHLYYNCTPETPSASCSLHQATTGLDETENEYACGCPYLAEMCDLEQAETSTVWKDTVRGYTVAILKGNLTYGLNGGYKRYHTTTVSSDTCESTGSRVLCKPPPASIELSPPNQTPDCTTSFSTKTGASSSDDGLCVNECIIATQGECSKATNAWLCVVKKVSNCFIPNKAKSTCFIETEVGNYQAEFQSCSCPEASMPCTEEEVEATRYEWEPTFAPDNAYIVVAPNKVLGPTKTIQPDYGMAAEPGCGSSRYKRVFCRGTSGNTSVTRYDATADCENARSLDASVISDFECRYGCSTRIKKCKAIMTQNPDVHESEYACYTAQLNTIPKLRQCLVESKLVDPETGVGSMEAGFIVVTQEWTSVAFKKEIENPVVVTSLPATTNAVPVIQVKGVNSTGFKIRMKNDFCSVGFASPYTSVGWLASSQGTFLVSGAKSYVRVGTTLASLNQPTTIRHLPRMNSAAPLVFLQHEDSEGGSGNYIVASTVTASSASEATFKLTLVGSGQPSEPIVIGYMIFDEIRQEYCSLGCQLNGISMQTDYADSNERWTAESTDNVILAGQTVVYGSVVDPDGTSPVFVSKHDVAWSSGNEIRSEGGVILDWRYAVPGGKDEHARSHPSGAQTSDSKTSKNDIGESLMQVSENLSVPGARSGWYPAIDIIYNSKCTVGSVSRTNIFPAAGGRKNSVSRRLVALLYVSSGTSEISSSSFPPYGADCASAAGKKNYAAAECAAQCEATVEGCTDSDEDAWPCFFRQFPIDQKKKCYITAVASDLAATSTTTAPPVDKDERCVLVDMSEAAYSAERGWDPETMTCKCPNDAPACSAEQATYNLINHSSVALGQGAICAAATGTVSGIARHFKRSTLDLCGDLSKLSPLSWEQLPLPPYMADDVILDDEVIRSGHYLCTKSYHHVFCPSSLITTSTTTPEPKWDWPARQDCVPGEWTSWSKCSMDCYVGSGALPVKSRSRSVLVDRRGTGNVCVLEDHTLCKVGSEVPYCEDLCWITDWGDWSGCEQKVLQIGQAAVRARTKLRHIFMGTGGVCSSDHIQYDYSGCKSGMDSSGGREDDSAHSMVEQKSRVTDAGCKKSSGWSACSLPCQQPGANAVTQQFQLGLPETVTASTTSYCASRSRACVEKKPPCVLDVAPDCSLVKPRYDSPEEALYCHELCNNALTRCREQAALQFQTQWECIMAFINSSGVTGRCQIQKGAVSKTTLRPPVCFLSRTRQVDASKSLSFLTTDKTSGRGSCMCAVTNSVPCSPEEVALSFDDWAKQLGSTVCPFGQLGAFFNSPNSKGSADSFVYFGASDLGRVHCPISKSSDLGSRFPTFTEFESPESMNNFCENGLPFWQEKREPLVDCRQVIPKNASTTDCPGRCHKAVVNCMVSNDSLDNCINEALSAGDFAENCELQSSVKLGKGLMFCKRIRTDCEYSEWSEWSECSRTCRSGGDDEESVRVRGRKLLVAAEHGGSCDADIEDSHGGSLSDVQLCDWLPPCDALADTETYVIMPKPEPKLADWSATRTTTTTVIPDLQNENKILCTIVDMADFSKSHRGYDTETESCKCPYNARVCSRTEAVNSRDNWDELMQTVCESNGQGQILAQGMETFSCSDRVFRSFRGTLGQTPEAHCKSEDATYIFCEDGAIDNDLIFTEVMMSIITGVVMGIAVVYWAIQYSGDVQKVLGLAGRYVELTNLLHEVSQEPQAHEEEKAEEGEGPDEDAEPEAAVEGNSEFDCNPRAKEENGEESEQDASDSESGSDDDDDIVSEE